MNEQSSSYSEQQNKTFYLHQPSINPEHNFNCQCQMCKNYSHKKLSQMMQQRKDQISKMLSLKLQNNSQTQTYLNKNQQYLEWVINCLMLPTNKIVNQHIQVFIPQICFYHHGEIQCIFMNKQIHDCALKKIHKDKINPNFMQKLFTQRRKKMRDSASFENNSNIHRLRRLSLGSRKQHRKQIYEAVVVCFDGYEQLLGQNQFSLLLQKRKQDPVWKHINYIKNYIDNSNQSQPHIYQYYEQNAIKYNKLMNRARFIMEIYGQNVLQGDHNYISQKQEQLFLRKLQRKNSQLYGCYMLYKIVCFIEKFHDQCIIKLGVQFVIKERGDIYLLQVSQLQYRTKKFKFSWTNQMYIHKMQQNERNLLNKEIISNENIEQSSKKIQNLMDKSYCFLKNKFGLSLEQKDDVEEKNNDKFFNFLHPQFQYKLSDILKKKKHLKILNFKKKYLGYIPKKKSVALPFNSIMVETLNKLTPKLKITKKKKKNQFSTQRKIQTNNNFNLFQRNKMYKTISSYNYPSQNISKRSKNFQ